jgi:hypothetical protein
MSRRNTQSDLTAFAEEMKGTTMVKQEPHTYYVMARPL